jgi:hypothetical protein
MAVCLMVGLFAFQFFSLFYVFIGLCRKGLNKEVMSFNTVLKSMTKYLCETDGKSFISRVYGVY